MPTGRGATHNPPPQFAQISLHREPDAEHDPPDDPKTRFWEDSSRSLLSQNQSPDIPFDVSANPYRGCEHGCSYCYARPSHEYLGWSPGLDFETQILVKTQAARLLREQLQSRSWRPQVVALSGVTDPYQPIERKLRITRECLQVLLEFRNPVQIITKSQGILRDLDLLTQLARLQLVRCHLSVTTLNPELCRLMEPRAAAPEVRLKTISVLSQARVPVTVMASPIIPGLNDHEIPEILRRASEAGALSAGYIPLRLPGAVAPIFRQWLEEHFPERSQKVLKRVQSMRGGKLNDSRFHSRFQGEGPVAEHLSRLFELSVRRARLTQKLPELRLDLFRRTGAGPQQLDLF